MRRYKLQTRTYMILISTLFAFTSLLVVAIAQEPASAPDALVAGDGTGAGDGLVAPQPSVIGEYRGPIIAISVVGILGAGGALAFSGGVKYIDRRNVLESPIRREMFTYIQNNPGVYLREISRALEINPTNTTWHLRKLTEAELIKCQNTNGLKLYYPVEGGVRTKQTAVANSILKNENAQTIVAYLLAHPGAHQREIARALGVNHGTVRWHLKKLVTSSMVNEHPDGAAYKYYISAEGMEVLSQSPNMGDVFATHESTTAGQTLPEGASFAHAAHPNEPAEERS